MTRSQKIMLRQSEVREKINGLLDNDDRTDEQNTELETLTGEIQKLEPELRAALAAEPDPKPEKGEPVDAETRERLELRSKVKVANWVGAALNDGEIAGAEKEYAAAEGCPGYMPLSVFENDRELETRAVTPAPTSDTQATQHPIMPAIFQRSIASELGIDMPTVGVGTQLYPVLSTSVTAGMKAAGAAGPETAAAFSVNTATMARLTGSFKVRLEDLAMLAGMESSLRSDIGMVMRDQADEQMVNGNGTSPNLSGVLHQLTDPTNPGDTVTFDSYVSTFADGVDGLWANDLKDVRVLCGPQTYAHAAKTFRGTDGGTSAATYLRSHAGGFRATKRIAAPPSSGTKKDRQQAILRRMAQGVRIATAPVWTGMRIIRDEYTNAAKGEIVLTAVSLIGGVVIHRSDAYKQIAFKVA